MRKMASSFDLCLLCRLGWERRSSATVEFAITGLALIGFLFGIVNLGLLGLKPVRSKAQRRIPLVIGWLRSRSRRRVLLSPMLGSPRTTRKPTSTAKSRASRNGRR